MNTIVVNRFKPYRRMRWIRSDYLWQDSNPYLAKYKIKIEQESTGPHDVIAIPCPHLPGKEAFVHRDNVIDIARGHHGTMDFQDTPLICDSSLDYAYLDPVMRSLISHPQVRAYMPGATFRNLIVQQRGFHGGEYYGTVYHHRELYNSAPSPRQNRHPMTAELQAKIQPLNRPVTPPFSDAVFEYIAKKVKPLKQRSIDLLFSGRTQYGNPPTPSYPTRHRQNLERVWPTLPGRKIFKSYDDYSGTLKRGKKIEVYKYPYEYVDALMDAKVIISPWGWSPWCIRDLEAMACGCIVIKPECSNMLIYPDIYDPHRQLLVWCDILYEKLGSQLFYIYKSLDEMQDRADRGRHFVTDALYPNDKIYASWTKDLRRILENALERPAYSVASQMVDFNS